MIPVTKTYLPPREEYERYLKQIWEAGWVTNNGSLATGLEHKLERYLSAPHLQLVSSGTMALQIALHVLDVSGEVITTPFSYVATTSSILWEHCRPVFVDIENDTLTIDPDQIEAAITDRTSAIVATHIYGIPCRVDAIAQLASKYDLKVIYDAAHAFGVTIEGEPICNFGDLSVLSFHATKLFHTIEGGALVCSDKTLAERIFLSKTFGHRYKEYIQVGINGKNSELHAAMGHCLLPRVDAFIDRRRALTEAYRRALKTDRLRMLTIPAGVKYNYSYVPVIFDSEELLLSVKSALKEQEIYTRRYFYPSLNELRYLEDTQHCPVSSDISRRVLCLPIYVELSPDDVQHIAAIVNETLAKPTASLST